MDTDADSSSHAEIDPETLARLVHRPARELALVLDFDGTLSEIVPRPSDAVMRPGIRRALTTLVGRGIRVAVVSGRALDDIAARASLPGAWIVGSHGEEMLDGEGARVKLVKDNVARRALDDVLAVALAVAGPMGALVEDKGLSVAVHLRGLTEAARAELVTKLGAQARADASSPVVTLSGIEVFEIRARSVDKGRATRTLLDVWGVAHSVAIGDDVTDEDMLVEVALRGGHAIKVGNASTAARFRLSDPAAVEQFLRRLEELGGPEAERDGADGRGGGPISTKD